MKVVLWKCTFDFFGVHVHVGRILIPTFCMYLVGWIDFLEVVLSPNVLTHTFDNLIWPGYWQHPVFWEKSNLRCRHPAKPFFSFICYFYVINLSFAGIYRNFVGRPWIKCKTQIAICHLFPIFIPEQDLNLIHIFSMFSPINFTIFFI